MTRKELSKKLRPLRKISAPELAKVSGLREAQISNMEHGKVNYTIDKLLDYCNCIGVEIEFKPTPSGQSEQLPQKSEYCVSISPEPCKHERDL